MEESSVVGIVAKNSLDYIKTIFNAYQLGDVVVLLRSVDDHERIKLTGVTRVVDPEDRFGWFTDAYQFSDSEKLAQVSFTSGTEGEPKGVLLTHQALSDVTVRLNIVMETDSTIREYVGVSAQFSFGLGRFRAISAVGGAAYLPEFGFNPTEIRDMLERGEINSLSAVPTLWRVLLKNKSLFGDEVLRLKWIEIGSQYMSRKEKEELKLLFPSAIIVQHYGLTEASRTTFLRLDKVNDDSLESVGSVIEPVEVKISEAGGICIRGAHVADKLLKQGEYISNVDEQGWFETNDLGRIKDGCLYYEGRADDLINCGGIKLSPDALERDLRENLNIKEGLAIARYDDALTGNGVLVVKKVSLELEKAVILTAMTNVLLNYGINNRNVINIIEVDELPVTSTGKVKRKELSKLYNLGQCEIVDTNLNSGTYKEPSNDLELSLTVAWQKVFNLDRVGVTDNFFELGGDSLMTIRMVVEMELASGIKFDIGDVFSHPTIEQLVVLKQSGKQQAASSIVPLQKLGGGMPLFFLCGINLYQELADSLGELQPVYGIYVAEEQVLVNAVMEGKESELSVVHLANLYSEAILRRQPEGPYQLGGISFGGLLAIETARILKEKGAEVSIVILLDTILPSSIQLSTYAKLRKVIKNCLIKGKRLYNSVEKKELQLADVVGLREKAYRQAMEIYDVDGEYYDGPVILIKAKEQHWGRGVSLKDDYGWDAVINGEVTIYEIEGDHLGIIKKPNVLKLAEILKPYMLGEMPHARQDIGSL